jgi:predicted nucleic acid-binding protein
MMPVDPRQFNIINIIDTCSIWNILSSKILYGISLSAHSNFSCTGFVNYECLYKPRIIISDKEKELQHRLKQAKMKGQFETFHISTDDLNDLEILNQRKKLSKGELSSIIFAKRIRQSFLTDDQGARKLACQFLQDKMVQTTPHLFGWLFYIGLLSDSDKDAIINEHESFKRPLRKHFDQIYLRALEYKLAYNS